MTSTYYKEKVRDAEFDLKVHCVLIGALIVLFICGFIFTKRDTTLEGIVTIVVLMIYGYSADRVLRKLKLYRTLMRWEQAKEIMNEAVTRIASSFNFTAQEFRQFIDVWNRVFENNPMQFLPGKDKLPNGGYHGQFKVSKEDAEFLKWFYTNNHDLRTHPEENLGPDSKIDLFIVPPEDLKQG